MGNFVYNLSTESEEMKKSNLTSQVDGETTVFSVPEAYKTGSLRVYYNGVRQIESETFTETTTTTFTTTFTPQTGDYLAIDYTPQS